MRPDCGCRWRRYAHGGTVAGRPRRPRPWWRSRWVRRWPCCRGQDAGGPPAEHAYGVSDGGAGVRLPVRQPVQQEREDQTLGSQSIRHTGRGRVADGPEARGRAAAFAGLRPALHVRPRGRTVPETLDRLFPCRQRGGGPPSIHGVRHEGPRGPSTRVVPHPTRIVRRTTGISAPRQGRIPGCRHKGGSTSTSPSNTASAGSR